MIYWIQEGPKQTSGRHAGSNQVILSYFYHVWHKLLQLPYALIDLGPPNLHCTWNMQALTMQSSWQCAVHVLELTLPNTRKTGSQQYISKCRASDTKSTDFISTHG